MGPPEKSNLEYRGLAEFIGFNRCQKFIVSWTVTFGVPLLMVGGFLFLYSFYVTSNSSSQVGKIPKHSSDNIHCPENINTSNCKREQKTPQADVGSNP